MTDEISGPVAAAPPPSKRRIQFAILISIVSLVFSGVSLYETVLKQPELVLSPGHNWGYERSPTSRDDTFIAPLTITNWGAQGDIVNAVEFVLERRGPGGERDGEQKAFEGNYIQVSPNREDRRLFAPFSIGGRQSISYAIVFNQSNPETQPLVDRPGDYRVRLKLLTGAGRSGGFLTRMLGGAGLQTDCSFRLDSFDENQAIPPGQGVRVKIDCNGGDKP